jgi:hypothetical protein
MIGIGDVAGYCDCLARPGEVGDRSHQVVAGAAIDDHRPTVGNQGPGDCQPESS